MAAGQSITVSSSIGDPLTGTIKGSTVIPAPADGNNIINIDQIVSTAITPSGDQTIYADAIAHADIQALGFVATLVTAGSGTASVVVKLKGAAGSGDVTWTLTPTQGQPNGVAFASIAAAGITANMTSITVTPSADGAVVEVQGKIYTTT
jgi:hypothetical protein